MLAPTNIRDGCQRRNTIHLLLFVRQELMELPIISKQLVQTFLTFLVDGLKYAIGLSKVRLVLNILQLASDPIPDISRDSPVAVIKNLLNNPQDPTLFPPIPETKPLVLVHKLLKQILPSILIPYILRLVHLDIAGIAQVVDPAHAQELEGALGDLLVVVDVGVGVQLEQDIQQVGRDAGPLHLLLDCPGLLVRAVEGGLLHVLLYGCFE